ncbi:MULTISPECIES: hypothetical protein [unclassified Lebetimonas]|uniref:hypothetical protein n=1 Tax=unclassified Lebetimonas TaxID=2648158 RepID=UPI0004654862|nr:MULTISPECIES: hypothetical protein [unclassified Lebetimonas]
MNIYQAVNMMSQITNKSKKAIKEEIRPIIEAFEELGLDSFAKNIPTNIIDLYLYGVELSNKDYYFSLFKVREFLMKEFNLRGIQADNIIFMNGKVDHWILLKLAAYRILGEKYPEDEYNTLKTLINYYVSREKEQKENYLNEYKKAIAAWKAQIKELEQLLNKTKQKYDKSKIYGFDKQEIDIIENQIITLCETIKNLNDDIAFSSLNTRYFTVIM